MVDSRGEAQPGAKPNASSQLTVIGRARWTHVGVLCLSVLVLALAGAASASADRSYDSHISGLGNPWGVAVDPADNLWVSDVAVSPGVSKYNAYPSQTLLGTQGGGGHLGPFYLRSLAVNSANNDLYVADSGSVIVAVFENGTGPFIEQWSGFGGGYDYLAIANSGGPANGRVYVAYTPGSVQVFDPNHNPVNFSTLASYITGNRITGTPGGSFGQIRNVAVDSEGNIYIVDAERAVVDEFNSSGAFIHEFNGLGAPGGFSNNLTGAAVDPTSGNLLVVDAGKGVIDEFDASGNYLSQLTGTGPTQSVPFGTLNGGIAINSNGYIYLTDGSNHAVDIFTPGTALPKITNRAVSNADHTSVTLNATVDPREGGNITECRFEYGTDASYGLGSVPCVPDPSASPPGSNFSAPTDVSADISGLSAETTYHYRAVASNADPHGQARGADQTFTPKAVLALTTGAATDVTTNSLILNASYVGDGNDTQYYFEFGGDTSYGHRTPLVDNGSGEDLQNISAEATNLQSHFVYHFRIVATNVFGTTYGQDEVAAETPEAPSINGLSSADLTPTTATLGGQINPQGFDTTYHFEYGTTPGYEASAPVPAGNIYAGSVDQGVEVHLTNLQSHVTYHFRLVATSKWGTTVTEDQTFNFYPPSCPNENVRQQTQANYLPDCRAYELVSPSDAGGTQLYPGGPNPGFASSPSRFAFVGLWNTIPESGGEPANTVGDLYVATRTGTGWTTRYVGLPSSKASVSGGPPQGFPGSANGAESFSAGLANGLTDPSKIQNGVLTNRSMSNFLVWDDGNQSVGSDRNPKPIASNAPYVVGADGDLIDRWPTNLATVPDGLYPPGTVHSLPGGFNEPLTAAAGGARALDCPNIKSTSFGRLFLNDCPGDVTASEDLSHFMFATRWNRFSADGQLSAPGSVYDNNTSKSTITVASRLASGDPIPPEPGNLSGDPLQIPAVSSDGSHILMAAGAVGPCGEASCVVPACEGPTGNPLPRCPMRKSHLYMRVDQALTYDVSEGSAVTYVGMTPPGNKVYFTTAERLTSDDTDESTDLYMWSESKAEQAEQAISLISLGSQGEGNRDNCTATFTAKCGVVTYSAQSYCQLAGGRGGNCRSDNSIASGSGDIYFFSPEQLGGSHGSPNKQNLYVFREGHVQYVTTFSSGQYCLEVNAGGFSSAACSNTPIVRMQVTPADDYMAFVTASQITGYNNAGRLEMYRYGTATGRIVCVSCIPDGSVPTSNVEASQNGLFMADDGRAFFSTEDALAAADTNHALDVYEYVEGRAQLITPGTGESQSPVNTISNPAGLVGVSASGADVYFSTFSSLVRQDHNGLFLKFYDARSGGGFSAPAPPPPCEAADECHGPASSPAPAIAGGTGASLIGGNVTPSRSSGKKKRRHGKRKPSKAAHRHRHGARSNHRVLGGSQ